MITLALDLVKAEKWRPVPGFPEYTVSNLGRVRRMGRAHGAKWGRVLTPWISGRYPYVGLWRGDRQTKVAVHRLVALAFLPPPSPGQTHVAHCNGRPTDNQAANLRWATPAENAADRELHGTGFRGEFNPAAKLTRIQVLEIRRLRAAGEKYAEIGRRFSIDRRTASDVSRGRRWGHMA